MMPERRSVRSLGRERVSYAEPSINNRRSPEEIQADKERKQRERELKQLRKQEAILMKEQRKHELQEMRKQILEKMEENMRFGSLSLSSLSAPPCVLVTLSPCNRASAHDNVSHATSFFLNPLSVPPHSLQATGDPSTTASRGEGEAEAAKPGRERERARAEAA